MSQDMPPACDYVVAFVDLLGQKDAMRDRHLPLDQNEALEVIKTSVGKVLGTQKHFQEFITGFTSRSGIYSNLPEYIQKVYLTWLQES